MSILSATGPMMFLDPTFDKVSTFRILELNDNKAVAAILGSGEDSAPSANGDDSAESLPTKRSRGDHANTSRLPLFTLKGGDQTVLCKDGSTYNVRRIEHSNALLVVQDNAVVIEKQGEMFETVPSSHKCEELFDELGAHFLGLNELEGTEDGSPGAGTVTAAAKAPFPQGPPTMQELVRHARSSEAQLLKFLGDNGCVQWKGRVRMMDPVLVHEVAIAAVTHVSGSEEPNFNEVPVLPLRAVLEVGFPSMAVDVALRWLTKSLAFKKSETVSFDPINIALTVAEHVFRRFEGASGKQDAPLLPGADPLRRLTFRMALKDFQHDFMGILPRGLEGVDATTLESLKGHVIVENFASANAAVAHWVPRRWLPKDVTGVIRALFARVPSIEVAVLKNYVEPVLDTGDSFFHASSKMCREGRTADGSTVISYTLA